MRASFITSRSRAGRSDRIDVAPAQYNLPERQLSWRAAFRFPIATPDARRDVVIGGLLLFTLLLGWILNLGNRLNVVSRLYNDDPPYFRGFRPWTETVARGCVSASTIASYLSPAAVLFTAALLSWRAGATPPLIYALATLGAAAFVLAVFTLPGCMTVYAVERDPAILRHPITAFRRAWERRSVYLRAWLIGLAAMVLSLAGLLLAGIGFLFTSVWAWEVVGYAFTVAMYTEPEQEAAV
jgi:hypothetical protein